MNKKSDFSVFSYRCDNPSSVPNLPLSGLRLAVKDIYHIKGIATGMGNPDWFNTHEVPDTTASLVLSLLDSGATLVGKTQTDELTYSLNGNNMHYGAALNPQAPTRLAGGSSSGSASAVAQNLADIGLGSDTGGSIRVPASYCGLYGMRTTHGILALDNVIGLAPGFDTAGWMTRDLDSYIKVAQVLLPVQDALCPDKYCVLQCDDPAYSAWNQASLNWAEQQLAQHCSESKTVTIKPDWFKCASETFRILQGRQIWRTHGKWITDHQPVFAEDIDTRFKWCASLTQLEEDNAEHDKKALLDAMQKWCPDASWVTVFATTPGAAPQIAEPMNTLVDYRNQLLGMTAPAGLAGWPQLHLPTMEDKNAPWGISLLGRENCDQALIKLAEIVI